MWAFFSEILATVIGGILLAFLFFLAREKLFPLPDITGRWFFEIKTIDTSYTPYSGMVLRYIAMLWREGNRIHGSVEKIHENSSTGKRDFVGKNRTRGIVDGYLEKNYLGKDHLYLHVIEDGHGRESTTFYEMTVESGSNMNGSFDSMVANSSGEIRWQRESF